MRFVVATAIWLIMVGGLWGYTQQRDAAVKKLSVAAPINMYTEDTLDLLVTATFAIEKDPFALDEEESADSGIEIRLNGNTIIVGPEEIVRGKVQKISSIGGVLRGHNEVYVKASPPVSESDLVHGIRIQVVENDVQIADHTIWNSAGSLVSGTVIFELGEGEKGKDHDH